MLRIDLLAILAAVLAGGALTFGTKLYYQGLIAGQERRNDMLRTEIAALDNQLEGIEDFEALRDQLLERMAIIEELQAQRLEAVHLMDELVTIMPSGVYLAEVTQQSRNIEITGRAQSNGRIARLLRNIANGSESLRRPSVRGTFPVDSAEGGFRMTMEQVREPPQR